MKSVKVGEKVSLHTMEGFYEVIGVDHDEGKGVINIDGEVYEFEFWEIDEVAK
jgi:hypothetical protein